LLILAFDATPSRPVSAAHREHRRRKSLRTNRVVRRRLP
jgi:hypothetical protein